MCLKVDIVLTVLNRNVGLLFKLQQQRLIEMIREGKVNAFLLVLELSSLSRSKRRWGSSKRSC